MAPDDRPCHEVRTRETPIALRLMEVRKRAISASLIEPLRHAFQDLGADGFRCDSRSEEFPVGFGVQVTAVEGQAVALADGMVPVRLNFVDVAGDEAGAI